MATVGRRRPRGGPLEPAPPHAAAPLGRSGVRPSDGRPTSARVPRARPAVLEAALDDVTERASCAVAGEARGVPGSSSRNPSCWTSWRSSGSGASTRWSATGPRSAGSGGAAGAERAGAVRASVVPTRSLLTVPAARGVGPRPSAGLRRSRRARRPPGFDAGRSEFVHRVDGRPAGLGASCGASAAHIALRPGAAADAV